MRLKFQLTSALLSSAGGRQAEFEEISEAGITSPALIRASERPFFFLANEFWGLRVQAGCGGCSVPFVNTNMAKFPPESRAVSVTQCSVLFIYARPERYRVQRCGLLIVLVQDSVRVNVFFFSFFIFSFIFVV